MRELSQMGLCLGHSVNGLLKARLHPYEGTALL